MGRGKPAQRIDSTHCIGLTLAMIFRRTIAHVLACAWIAFISATALAADKAAPATSKSLATHSTSQRYPEAPRADVVDDYHGTQVADPYRPLEDPDSAATRAWVEAENKITFGFLATIPARGPLKERLTGSGITRSSPCRSRKGALLLQRQQRPAKPERALHHRLARRARRRSCSIPTRSPPTAPSPWRQLAVSDDGTQLAYGLAEAGSDWITWKVRDVETGRGPRRPGQVEQVLGRLVDQGRQGLFLRPLPRAQARRGPAGVELLSEALLPHARHAAERRHARSTSGPTRRNGSSAARVTDDGKYLVIEVSKGTDDRNRVLYKQLDKPDVPIVELIANFDAGYELIDNDGPVFFFKTNKDAPRGRVIAIDTRQPERGALEGDHSPGRGDAAIGHIWSAIASSPTI